MAPGPDFVWIDGYWYPVNGRYVWHEPVVRRILLRAIMFVTPGMALWALLPLIASQHLRVGADGFGALFGALGAGAVLGAWVLGRVKTSLSTNAILIVAAKTGADLRDLAEVFGGIYTLARPRPGLVPVPEPAVISAVAI